MDSSFEETSTQQLLTTLLPDLLDETVPSVDDVPNLIDLGASAATGRDKTGPALADTAWPSETERQCQVRGT